MGRRMWGMLWGRSFRRIGWFWRLRLVLNMVVMAVFWVWRFRKGRRWSCRGYNNIILESGSFQYLGLYQRESYQILLWKKRGLIMGVWLQKDSVQPWKFDWRSTTLFMMVNLMEIVYCASKSSINDISTHCLANGAVSDDCTTETVYQ
jgi:hypothetical protein